MLKYQVLATLSTEQSFVGEIVVFNCTGSKDETPREQAERYVETFRRVGNGMIETVAKATGAICIEYRARIA